MTAEPDGLVTWKEYWEQLAERIGYPISGGTKEWRGMIDLRGIMSIDSWRFCGIGEPELGSTKWKCDDLTDVSIMQIDFFDLKDGWYPIHTVDVYRDGSVAFTNDSDYNNHGLVLVNEVDEWVLVFYRTGPYQQPTLKLSLVNPGDGWSTLLEGLGVKKFSAGLGYRFKYNGRALPIDKSNISTYGLNLWESVVKDIEEIIVGVSPLKTVKAKEICPYCGKGFKQISKHVCKKKPKDDPEKQELEEGEEQDA
jgi:hypothetical protein